MRKGINNLLTLYLSYSYPIESIKITSSSFALKSRNLRYTKTRSISHLAHFIIYKKQSETISKINY